MTDAIDLIKIKDDAVAIVNGEVFTDLPVDLYIPPDALEIFLDAFEGPLDLLLYLIKKQNVNILDIPIAEITRQYMSYVDMMKSVHLELAGEYLVMAAMLAEIKSRMMLPKLVSDEEEDDPRAELIRRLQEYERFKNAAAEIEELPRCGRDFYLTEPVHCQRDIVVQEIDVILPDLLHALKDVMKRAELFNTHHIKRETLSVRERMTWVLNSVMVDKNKFVDFAELFNPNEGRRGIVVTFLAILELIKSALIEVVQTEVYGPIHVKAR